MKIGIRWTTESEKKKKNKKRKQYLDRTNYVSYGVAENKMFKNEKGHWNAQ